MFASGSLGEQIPYCRRGSALAPDQEAYIKRTCRKGKPHWRREEAAVADIAEVEANSRLAAVEEKGSLDIRVQVHRWEDVVVLVHMKAGAAIHSAVVASVLLVYYRK